jgi:hypothetical protein
VSFLLCKYKPYNRKLYHVNLEVKLDKALTKFTLVWTWQKKNCNLLLCRKKYRLNLHHMNMSDIWQSIGRLDCCGAWSLKTEARSTFHSFYLWVVLGSLSMWVWIHSFIQVSNSQTKKLWNNALEPNLSAICCKKCGW